MNEVSPPGTGTQQGRLIRMIPKDRWTILLAAVLFVPVGIWIHSSPIVMGVCLAAGCAALLYLMNPLKSTMVFIVTKTLTDAAWFVKISVAGFDLSLQRMTGVVFPCLGLATIYLYARQGRRFHLPLTRLLLVFSLYAAMNTLFSPLPKEALADVIKLIGSFVFFYLGCLYFRDETHLRHFARLYALVGLFPFLSVVLQQAGVIDLLASGVPQSQVSWMGGESVRRYAGVYSDAATTSIFILVPLSFVFAAVTEERRTVAKRFYLLLGGCYVYALYVSSFRIVWGALFVQIILWFYTGRSRKTFWMLICLSVVLAAAYAEQIIRVFDLSIVLRPEGLSGKMGFWILLWRVFASADWLTRLFGHGFMANAFILNNTREATIAGTNYIWHEGWAGKAHSDFVEFLTDMGILGLAAYLAILWRLGCMMWQMKERGSSPFSKLIVRSWLCIFSTYLLYSMIGNSSRYPALTWPMWFLAGGLLNRDGVGRDRAP